MHKAPLLLGQSRSRLCRCLQEGSAHLCLNSSAGETATPFSCGFRVFESAVHWNLQSAFVTVFVRVEMERPMSLMMLLVAMILVSNLASNGLCLKQDIYVPSYVYPCAGTSGCAWDVFKDGATLVVLNPDSGPGNESMPEFVDLRNTVKSNGSTVQIVLGYVFTAYSRRDPALVLADIDKYYSFYNVDGIFLDEGANTCENATIARYKSYDDHVKAKGGLGYTALNWGTQGNECYLTNTNINTYVTYEGSLGNYSSMGAPSDFVTNYDSTRFWNILHSAPTDATGVLEAVALSKSRNVGHIYITDDSLVPDENPYDTAPSTSVWEAEKTGAENDSLIIPTSIY